MGAGGLWAAGEGVVDGAHGFRVVKKTSGFRVCKFFYRRCCVSGAKKFWCLLYLKLWYSFYIRFEYQRLHENNLAWRRQLMCGGRGQRTEGGGVMRCKGEEDIIICNMGVISTNSHVCEHKLCSLCVRSKEFKSWGITTAERMKNTVRNDASSSNLKGKPMTKTIWLHWSWGIPGSVGLNPMKILSPIFLRAN